MAVWKKAYSHDIVINVCLVVGSKPIMVLVLDLGGAVWVLNLKSSDFFPHFYLAISHPHIVSGRLGTK